MVALSDDAVNRLVNFADKDRERRELNGTCDRFDESKRVCDAPLDATLQVATQSPSASKYRASPRPTVRAGPTAAAQSGEEEAIERFGLTILMPGWTERMRRWISTMIVQPLVQRIVELETVRRRSAM